MLAEAWQDDFAFLIKTGSLTAQSRVPMQLLTFLSRIKNYILVGAEPGARAMRCAAHCCELIQTI